MNTLIACPDCQQTYLCPEDATNASVRCPSCAERAAKMATPPGEGQDSVAEPAATVAPADAAVLSTEGAPAPSPRRRKRRRHRRRRRRKHPSARARRWARRIGVALLVLVGLIPLAWWALPLIFPGDVPDQNAAAPECPQLGIAADCQSALEEGIEALTQIRDADSALASAQRLRRLGAKLQQLADGVMILPWPGLEDRAQLQPITSRFTALRTQAAQETEQLRKRIATMNLPRDVIDTIDEGTLAFGQGLDRFLRAARTHGLE
jgi:hypothetical protein